MDRAPHTRLPFPFSIGLPSDLFGWHLQPWLMSVGVFAIIAVSVVLLTVSVCVLCFARPSSAKRRTWLLQSQSLIAAALALLLFCEAFAIVNWVQYIIAVLVDSYFGKLQITLEGLGEGLEFLGTWGNRAVVAAVAALFFVYAARTSRVQPTESNSRAGWLPYHLIPAAFSATSLIAASLTFGAALEHVLPHRDLNRYVFLGAFELERSSAHAFAQVTLAYRFAVVCVTAAAGSFLLAEHWRAHTGSRHEATKRLVFSVCAVCTITALALTAFTVGLAAEHATPIPVDHAFANLTLSIPPPLPDLRGIGPDQAYFGGSNTMRLGRLEASRFILPEAKSPDELYKRLRAERESRLASRSREARHEIGFDVSIDENLSTQQLREWLAAIYWAEPAGHMNLVMSHVVRLSRPVFGDIVGAKWTAARFEVRAVGRGCEQVHGPALDMTWPQGQKPQELMRAIVDARRRGNMPCVVVGDRLCTQSEPPEHACWRRLDASIEALKSADIGPGVRASRLRLDEAVFDVVEIARAHDFVFKARGAQSLADVRAAIERQHCQVVVSMNGGMFEPSYEPVGLFVSDGSVQVPLNERDGEGNFYMKPNGVFSVGSQGAHIDSGEDAHRLFAKLTTHSRVDPNTTWNATQSGPIVLLHGREHPAFNANSNSRAIRNAVGVKQTVGENTRVLFAISNTPVTFHELARLFTNLGYTDALYLDGRISRMDLPAFNRTLDTQKLGPVLALAECSDSN